MAWARVSTRACSVKRTSYPRAVPRSLKVAALVGIATLVVIYAALRQGRTAHATRALHVLPSTARAVLRIDPGAVRRSSAARTLLDAFLDEEQLSDIEATCGLDPLEDLVEVTVWVRGSEQQPFQSFGLMLTGGHADAAQIADCYEELVEARGGSVRRLEGPTGPLLASDDRGSAIARVDERTVVTGAVRTVTEAMAVRRGLLPTLAERGPIATLWRAVSPGAAVAAALDPPLNWQAALERITTFDTVESALQGIVAIGLAVRPGKAQAADVYLDAATPELAEKSAELIRAIAVTPPDAVEPPWDALLQSAKVAIAGSRIVVRVDVSTLPAPR
jgi:hypothetical protein